MKLLLICVCLCSSQVMGQALKWHDGVIVLNSQKVLAGQISIEANHDLILFRTGEVPTVYPAHKLVSLYFYDKKANVNRRYVTIRNPSSFGNTHQIFEIVLRGKVDVLRRQKSRIPYPSDAVDFHYYCRYENELMPLHKFIRRIYPELVKGNDLRLPSFVKDHRLKAASDANLITIIEFYNTISRQDEALAKH